MSNATLPPSTELPPELRPQPDPNALIKEARRRTRRRRTLYALAAALAAGAAVAGFAGFHGGSNPRKTNESSAPSSPSGPDRPAPVSNGPIAVVTGVSADRIALLGERGGLVRTLSICRPRYCGAIRAATWSPNGRTLAYVTGSTTDTEAPRDGLHLFDLKTNHDRLLSHDWTPQGLAWSPDGKRLAYVAVDRRSASPSVFVTRIAHLGRVEPILKNATSPSWSPDGRLLAFDRCVGGRSSGVAVASADGSHVRHLTRVGCSPAWAPDGSRIAYSVWCGLRLITPEGKQLTPPSPWRCQHMGVAGLPAWSPDANRIAIGASDGVYLVNRDGSGLRRIWDHAAPQQPAWRPVTRG